MVARVDIQIRVRDEKTDGAYVMEIPAEEHVGWIAWTCTQTVYEELYKVVPERDYIGKIHQGGVIIQKGRLFYVLFHNMGMRKDNKIEMYSYKQAHKYLVDRTKWFLETEDLHREKNDLLYGDRELNYLKVSETILVLAGTPIHWTG